MRLGSLFQKKKAGVIARVTLVIYAMTLTGLVIAALTVGPFKDPIELKAEIRVLEYRIKEKEKIIEQSENDQRILLNAIKDLQAEIEKQKKALEAYRNAGKDVSFEDQLAEAKKLVDKLSEERTFLMQKITDLQKDVEDVARSRLYQGGETISPEMSAIVQRLEKEKRDLEERLAEAEGKLKEFEK